MQKVLFLRFFCPTNMTGLWIFLLCVGVLWGATLPLKIVLKKDDEILKKFKESFSNENEKKE